MSRNVLHEITSADLSPETLFVIGFDGRQIGHISADDSGSTMRTMGMYDVTPFDATSSSGLDSDGRFLLQDSAATIDQFAGTDLLSFAHRRELNSVVLMKFKLEQTTDIRFYAVMLDNLGFTTSILTSDTPAQEYVGVRYSTSAGDTTWRFVSSDGVSTNNVDSGIAIGTTARFVEITADNSVPNFTVRLLDENFSELASTTFTTNIPAAATNLGAGAGLRNLVAAVKSMKQYYWAGFNKK